MHVIVSTYHETSITKNIQYSSKRIIHFLNITKNGENDLQNTAQNVQNDPMDLHVIFDYLVLPF